MSKTQGKMPREAVMVPVLLGIAAVIAVIMALVVAAGTKSDSGSAPWLPWMLLVMGIAGLAAAVFDREQKPGPGSGWRTKGLVLLLGPTGARITFAVIGGGFLGGAIGLFAA